MPGRFPRFLSPLGKEWNEKTRHDIYEYLKSLMGGMSALQGTPETPSEIVPGVDASVGVALPPATADHIHPVATDAPSQSVALGGVASEGSAPSLLRSDATLVLSQGGAVNGEALIWETDQWQPRPVVSMLESRVFSERDAGELSIKAGVGVSLTRELSCVTVSVPGIPTADDASFIIASRCFGN